jgi:hypothetical protein
MYICMCVCVSQRAEQIHPSFAVLCLHVQKHSTTVGVVGLSTSRARACLPDMIHHSSQVGFDEEAQSDLRYTEPGPDRGLPCQGDFV